MQNCQEKADLFRYNIEFAPMECPGIIDRVEKDEFVLPLNETKELKSLSEILKVSLQQLRESVPLEIAGMRTNKMDASPREELKRDAFQAKRERERER